MSQVSLPGLLLGCPQTVFLPAGANGQVSYGGLSGGPFSIDPQTGLIVTTRVLDREEQEQHVLMGRAVLVREGCSRRGAGCSPLLGLAVLQGTGHGRWWEVVGLMWHVGLVWHAGFSGGLGVQDCPWSRAWLPWCLSGHSHVAARTAAPVSGRLQRSCCVPAVYARDGGLPPSLARATVRITVGDENDHAPHLESESCSVEVPENQSRVALYTLRATDPDGGENGRLEYRVAGEAHGGLWSLFPGGQERLCTLGCSRKCHLWQFLFHFILSCSKLHVAATASQPPSFFASSKEHPKIWTCCTSSFSRLLSGSPSLD